MDFYSTDAREYMIGLTPDNDRFFTGVGDFAVGNGGNDTFFGPAAYELGGLGNDTFYISDTSTVVVEYANQGTDMAILMLDPSGGYYTLPNNVENGAIISGSTLFGNGLDNTLFGNDAINFLVGGGGNDTIAPGYGADYMVGGTGNDTFTITNGDAGQFNGDTITDWNAGDVINLVTTPGVWDFRGNGSFQADGGAEVRTQSVHEGNQSEVLVLFDQNGDGVVDSTLTVLGDQHLHASDFVL